MTGLPGDTATTEMYGGIGNDTLTYQAKAGGSAFNGQTVLDGGSGYDSLVLDFSGDFGPYFSGTGYTMDFVHLGAESIGSISISGTTPQKAIT